MVSKAVQNFTGTATAPAASSGPAVQVIKRSLSAGAMIENRQRLLWTSWQNYPKVVLDSKEYARIGDRLYTRHAVERMLPSGLGAPAGTIGAGRSCAPTFVEEIIQNGTKQVEFKEGIERMRHRLGIAEVITERNGEIVITVNPFKWRE